MARGVYPVLDTERAQDFGVLMAGGDKRVFSIIIQRIGTTDHTNLCRCDQVKRTAFSYRRLAPFSVQVRECGHNDSKGSPLDIGGVVYVPDPSTNAVMKYPLTHLTFAHQRYDFSFAGGVLSEVAVRKESELLTIAEIPGNILGVVTGLPAKLIAVEVNHDYHSGSSGTMPYSDDKDPGRAHNNQEKTGN